MVKKRYVIIVSAKGEYSKFLTLHCTKLKNTEDPLTETAKLRNDPMKRHYPVDCY